MPTTEQDSERNSETVRRYAAAHTAGDVEALVALFAEDAVVADPVHEPPHVGHEAIRAFFTGSHAMVDALELELTGPVRAVDRFAAVPMRAVSTIGQGRVAVEIVDVFTFTDDGRIGDLRAYWNPGAVTPLD